MTPEKLKEILLIGEGIEVELGSGIHNSFKYCRIYTPGIQPEFIEDDIFKTIIPLKVKEKYEITSIINWDETRREVRRKFGEKYGISSEYDKESESSPEEDYGRITEEIISWMIVNPKITMEEMAQKIDKSRSTVEKTIKKLREADIVKRIGSIKAGHWKIEW